ncbi:MAG: hypothetical protein UHW86_04190 [Spirochaetota bacterium]|nr:hypothetical protein [Spirochaetota bacterium]
MKRYIFAVFFILFSLSAMFCDKQIKRFVDVNQLKEAGAPIFTQDSIILTLPPENAGRQEIFLVTDLDGWEKQYYFDTSLYGVYFCKLPYTDKSDFVYRLNVNGFWTVPNGSLTQFDNYGNELAKISIPDQVKYFNVSPEIEEINPRDSKVKKVTFRVYAPSASVVNLLCSNANFSPFTYAMVKDNAGYWEISLPLSCGNYSYCYFIDNIQELDINNPNKTMAKGLGRMSAFRVN